MDYIAKIGKKEIMRLIAPFTNPLERPVTPKECADCPYFQTMQDFEKFRDSELFKKAAECCRDCQHCSPDGGTPASVYLTKKFLVRERFTDCTKARKSLRGWSTYEDSASRSTLLIYLAIHLLCPDKNGIVNGVTVKELSSMCGITCKSVRKSLDWLSHNKSICVSCTDTYGTKSVLLCHYMDYFKDASHGGAGYIHLTKDIFEQLVSVGRDVTALRSAISFLVKTDIKTEITQKVHEMNIKQLKRSLPGYVTPSILDNAFHKFTELFNVKIGDGVILFNIREKMDVRMELEQKKEQAQKLVSEHISYLRKEISSFSAGKESLKLKELYLRYKGIPDEKHVALDAKKLKDTASLCIEYPSEIVLEVLTESFFVPIHLDKNKRAGYIKNLGAYIRERVKSILFGESFGNYTFA